MEVDKGKEVNDWFFNKFGPQLARESQKKEFDIKEKEKVGTQRYTKVRKQIEEQLATRRHEDMERRHRFYNADNELSNQADEEEEEEEGDFTDEEEELEQKRSNTEDEEVEDEDDENEIVEASDNGDFDGDVSDEIEGQICNSEDNDDDAEDMTNIIIEESDQENDEAADTSVRIRRRRNSSRDEKNSVTSNKPVRKRPRMEIASDDEESNICQKVVIDDEVEHLHPLVNNDGGGEFSHITLDLNAAATYSACSQDFNEALFLCSGTFGDNEEVNKESLVDQRYDLFTVDDDEADDSNANSSWPIKWSTEDNDEDGDGNLDEDDKEKENEVQRKPIKLKDIVDDEASLSGDDVSVGSDESDCGEDMYEPEEGDNDELPNEEEIRENLVRQYIKQTNDDDERRMIQLQEQFFADSDLHSSTNMDRSFRFRMRDDANVDWSKILGSLDDKEKDNSDNDEDDESNKKIAEKKVEMLKWRLEQEKKRCVFNDSANVECLEMFEQSSLLMLGEKAIVSKVRRVSSSMETTTSRNGSTNENELTTLKTRDSLLNKAGGALRHVFKETAVTNNHSLFTSLTKK